MKSTRDQIRDDMALDSDEEYERRDDLDDLDDIEEEDSKIGYPQDYLAQMMRDWYRIDGFDPKSATQCQSIFYYKGHRRVQGPHASPVVMRLMNDLIDLTALEDPEHLQNFIEIEGLDILEGYDEIT